MSVTGCSVIYTPGMEDGVRVKGLKSTNFLFTSHAAQIGDLPFNDSC